MNQFLLILPLEARFSKYRLYSCFIQRVLVGLELMKPFHTLHISLYRTGVGTTKRSEFVNVISITYLYIFTSYILIYLYIGCLLTPNAL